MFDDFLRQLQHSLPTSQKISISLKLDDAGYWDRRCPAEECRASFKVLFDDWKAKVPDEWASCPICGEIAEPQAFNTAGQRRQMRDTALATVANQFDEAARRARKPTINTGLVTMSWSYKPGARHAVVPASAQPVMSQQSECEVCGCHFASIGAAFFCPACGHNNARSTLTAAIKTVRDTVALAERMPTLVDDRDVAADTARQLLETSLARVWSSFQRFAEAAYTATPASAATPARRNAFQNLEASAALWQASIGMSYADMLSASEHADLVRLVQARHVVEHQHGMVDQDYATKSGDARYRVGQRLVISASDVRRLADLAEKLQAEIVALVP